MFGVGDASFAIGRVSLPETPATADRQRLTVRRHEIDPMAHANNAVYLDWLEETVAAAGRRRGRVEPPAPLSSRVRPRGRGRRVARGGGLAGR
jgi:hypothetical protein